VSPTALLAEAGTPAELDGGTGEEVPYRARAPLRLCVGLGFAGMVILRPGGPENTAFVDPVLALLCLVGMLWMQRVGSQATLAASRAMPWIWLILLGSFLGLATVGIPFWAISNLSRTLFAFFTFFCLWHLMLQTHTERAALKGTLIGLVVTVVALFGGPSGVRGQAFFQHPNYAGHFGVMATAVLLVGAKRWWTKAFVLACFAVVVLQTASFGAMAMALAMGAVVVGRTLARSTAALAGALAVVAIVGMFLANPGSDSQASSDSSSWSFNEVISEERFDRSQTGRLEAWGAALEAYGERPLGLGPDGVKNREVIILHGDALELHADALGYLVERGVIGLIGFLGLWAVLWQSAPRGGVARVLIVGALVQGVFRETMHYRHLWLLLAVAMVLDARRLERAEADEEAEAAEAEPGAVSSGASR
jgi:hypothetical protein